MRAYYTVVYRVDGDRPMHDTWWEAIRPLFLAEREPISISAMSKADEVTRLDCVEHIIKNRGSHADALEAIEAILVHPDPVAWWRENADDDGEDAADG